MIELLAVASEDGWAFVRSEGQIRLIRPPYRQRSHPTVEASAVDRALAMEGFTAEERSFPDWIALFGYLEQRFLESRPASKELEVSSETVGRILRHAPSAALGSFLDRIEGELFPAHQWEPAIRLLKQFLGVPKAIADTNLYNRALRLQEQCQLSLGTTKNFQNKSSEVLTRRPPVVRQNTSRDDSREGDLKQSLSESMAQGISPRAHLYSRLEKDPTLKPEVVEEAVEALVTGGELSLDSAIRCVYAAIRIFGLRADAEDEEASVTGLQERLRNLQAREADEAERRFLVSMRVAPGEGYRLLEWADTLLEGVT